MSFNATTSKFSDYVRGLPAASESDLSAGNNMPIVSASEIKKMGGENVGKGSVVTNVERNVIGGSFTPDFVITSGKSYNTSGQVIDNASYSYTSKIAVKQGDVLTIKHTCTYPSVPLIVQVRDDGGFQRILVAGGKTNFSRTDFSVTFDGFVAVSNWKGVFDQYGATDIVVNRLGFITEANQHFNAIDDKIISKNTTASFSVTAGYFYNQSGVLEADSHYEYTSPIPVRAGDVVTIKTYYSQAKVCAVVRTDEEGNFISKVYSRAQTSFVANEKFSVEFDGYIVISDWTTALNAGVTIYTESLLDKIAAPVNRWVGKDVVFFGDSFFDYGVLPAAIKNAIGCNVINRGVGGSVVVRNPTKPYQSLVQRLKEESGAVKTPTELTDKGDNYLPLPATADLVIVNCSVNDCQSGRTIGTKELGTSDDTKFKSAVQVVIKGLMEKYPNKPIVWINACHWAGEYSYNEDGTLKSGSSSNLIDYVDALEEICGLFGVPVVDAYRNSSITSLVASNLSTNTSDGLHPTAEGAKKIAELVKDVLSRCNF